MSVPSFVGKRRRNRVKCKTSHTKTQTRQCRLRVLLFLSTVTVPAMKCEESMKLGFVGPTVFIQQLDSG